MGETELMARNQATLAVPVVTDELLTAFADFMRLDVAQGDASPETIRSYWGRVRSFVAWCEEQGITPALLTEEDLKAYRAYLVEKGYKRTTIASMLAALRRFYHMAQARGYRADNPAEGLGTPREKTDRAEQVKWLPLAAVARLLEAPDARTVKGKRDRAILALMALHGLRVMEVQRLSVGDVDLEAMTVDVLGKGNKRRQVLLVDKSKEKLADWLAVRHRVAQDGERALFVNLHHNGEPGRAMSRRGIRQMVDSYLAELGLKRPGVSCHALRHSFATLSVAAGAKLQAVQDALGHASVSTTQIYAKIVDKARNNPALFLVGALEAVGSE